MPKVPMCTAAEAAEIRNQLTAAMEALEAQLQLALENTTQQLQGDLHRVTDEVAKHATTTEQALERVSNDSKAYTQASVDGMQDKLTTQMKSGEDKAAQSAGLLDRKIQKVDNDVRTALADELAALCEHFDRQMTLQKEEVDASAEKWAREVAEEMVKQRKEGDNALAELRKEAEAMIEASYQRSASDAAEQGRQLRQVLEDSAQRSKRAEGEFYLKLGQLEDELKELQQSSKAQAESVQRRALTELHELRDEAETRLSQLDTETLKLRDAVTEVENLSTRRVDWVIKNVSHRLRPSTPGSKVSLHTSWFSPKFNMAGAHGLQLEFQLFRPSDPPVEGESVGDCAVFLWACKGTSLMYKLYIGKKVATLEKVFNGRVPYGTKRLCFLKDQINREDDSLRVSVEILETVRELEHPVKPPPPPEDIDEREAAVQPLEGMVIFRRHVNNRIVDQVKKEVEIMRSRMVRRIEWRVEQASLLRRCFPNGESMCSAPFSAAGIENMQMMFYPSGYGGCSDGFCSVYLWAPAGTTLKCSLWAGNQRRDASHYFEEPGAFGRTNFCRFESAVDVDEDTVTLALDVEEAHQDVQATVAHPLVQPGDRRSQAQIDGDLPDKVDSVVKLKRVPGKTVQGMEDRRVLPNLWQAKSLSSDPVPEGFHSYDEIRGKVTTRTMTQSMSSPVVGAKRGEPISPSKEAIARLEGELVPLPQLSRTGGSDWALDYNASSKASRRGRLNGRKDRSVLSFTTAVAH
eukprot:CAMPEP_0171135954 /NCGR_PEP_ID=MMETSP0766_2-20121228/130658_1 /TAXON_ID=439317 /ORGANISM="Gambierdiscus australes, Strain CAWD 149" /LENGTH=745 /DNA_ID=CAMNT_0011599471 /DNA_START=12 /DNA_END=2249 /DNA_ORIENTATION=+